MSQFGMQMPGTRQTRKPGLDVYTGLSFLATVAMIAACSFLWVQGQKIGPADAGALSPLSVHPEGQIRLSDLGDD